MAVGELGQWQGYTPTAASLFEASLVSKYDNNKIAFVGIEAWFRSAGVPTKLALVAVGELGQWQGYTPTAASLFEASLVSKYDNNKIAFVGIEAWLRSAGVPTKLA